jgi:hypothetical protein
MFPIRRARRSQHQLDLLMAEGLRLSDSAQQMRLKQDHDER